MPARFGARIIRSLIILSRGGSEELDQAQSLTSLANGDYGNPTLCVPAETKVLVLQGIGDKRRSHQYSTSTVLYRYWPIFDMTARIAVVGTVPVIAPTEGGENETERERGKSGVLVPDWNSTFATVLLVPGWRHPKTGEDYDTMRKCGIPV